MLVKFINSIQNNIDFLLNKNWLNNFLAQKNDFTSKLHFSQIVALKLKFPEDIFKFVYYLPEITPF